MGFPSFGVPHPKDSAGDGPLWPDPQPSPGVPVPLLQADSPHEELLAAGAPQQGEQHQDGLHGGWERSLSPRGRTGPERRTPWVLGGLLSGAASAVPAASAATDGAGRKGSREPKCLLDLAKSTREQPKQGGSDNVLLGERVLGERPRSQLRAAVGTGGSQATAVGRSQEPRKYKETPLCFHEFLHYT